MRGGARRPPTFIKIYKIGLNCLVIDNCQNTTRILIFIQLCFIVKRESLCNDKLSRVKKVNTTPRIEECWRYFNYLFERFMIYFIFDKVIEYFVPWLKCFIVTRN